MSTRMLSTDTGRVAIDQMQRILASGLAEEIASLKVQGQTLSDENVWDGQLAESFRSQLWPGASRSLDAATAALHELRAQISVINAEIMTAGGNG
jgi:hypothetical protein